MLGPGQIKHFKYALKCLASIGERLGESTPTSTASLQQLRHVLKYRFKA